MAKKILVIEDDVDLNTIIELNLQKEGFETDHAYDGEEALKKVEEFQPDLIILDVMLPKLNGVEFNTKLKSNPKTKNIPIVALTGKLGTKELFTVNNQLTVSAFFYKPVLMKDMLAEIKKLLK
jgi:two-component system response regulator VicR